MKDSYNYNMGGHIMSRFTLPTLSILFVVFTSGYISTRMINSNKMVYTEQVNILQNKIGELVTKLDEYKQHTFEVDVTMYHPVYPQTDDTPHITADGTHFNISKASEYKYVALSRNLLKRWGGPFNYGDFIIVRGTQYKDGMYQVKDTMNPRWVNRIDILESTHVKPYKYENVRIYKINTDVQLVSH